MIPSTQEKLPVIGLGTWQTFDVPNALQHTSLMHVLQQYQPLKNGVIDSSPMYGKSEESIGELTAMLDAKDDFFYATKVWTTGKKEGIKQIEASAKKMKRKVLDLIQIHNVVDWKTHLETLRQWKEEGRVRYIGITHYTDDMHDELVKIIEKEKLDFVQFNYSIFDRNAEKKLLPAAMDCGVATLINRPFGEGKMFAKVKGKPLPDWAFKAGIDNWSSFFLKFIIAHPAVTCVIPATANPAHAAQNIKAGEGVIPDAELRKQMIDLVDDL